MKQIKKGFLLKNRKVIKTICIKCCIKCCIKIIIKLEPMKRLISKKPFIWCIAAIGSSMVEIHTFWGCLVEIVKLVKIDKMHQIIVF